MEVLVLGGAGMLGHKVVQRLLATDARVSWTLRGPTDDAALAPVPFLRGAGAIPGVDVARLDALEALVRDARPDVVVNCVGVIKQRAEAQSPIPSLTINSLLPHRLARLVGEWKGRFIHLSTDCVFSGRRGRYAEEDETDAVDLYGRTKALGEVTDQSALTLRTSMIGRELRHHQSLLEWFLSQRGGRVRGFTRHFWSGLTTPHLADLIATIVHDRPRLSGLHQVSSGCISKYDLLLELRRAYGVDVEIRPDESLHCDRSLVGTRFEQASGLRPLPLAEQITAMAADPTPYHALR